ncbi:GAF and ANTAR domain-containing protein [Mycolicibacterium sediminis]|uniref:Transcriptional regulator n=1 Tax=Mycolicibacterium sediminis TaxID=1286180 RepID=A0A7I7QKH8_9MYCO|nr:GAF and ANTAR domain-containing protein [Mycolicibacterium sediminis]BBY26838.1 transcriptional regulator [Mycolicibacterium sediminis]
MTQRPDPAEELVGMFARMSGMLLTETTVATALSTVTALAAETIAGSAGSGISLLDRDGRRITSAATDALVEQLDDAQYELDEGPCLTAWREGIVVRSDGSGDARRWPTWIARAHELGMRSFLSAPLTNGDDHLGAIKVYSTTVEAYDDHAEELLRRFAARASIFVGNVKTLQASERLSDQLKETLRSRDQIAMARGILMARNGIGAAEAFRELTAESHRSRRLVGDVAARIVASVADA